MKTLRYTVLILLANIVFAPCLLIFNEQPECEPQKWWINLIGGAYACGLIILYNCWEKRKSQKS
jgi:hypothetical protein